MEIIDIEASPSRKLKPGEVITVRGDHFRVKKGYCEKCCLSAFTTISPLFIKHRSRDLAELLCGNICNQRMSGCMLVPVDTVEVVLIKLKEQEE